MKDELGFEPDEIKEIGPTATPKERLKYIKNLALFHKSVFGDISYNDIQGMIDKIIKVSDA